MISKEKVNEYNLKYIVLNQEQFETSLSIWK